MTVSKSSIDSALLSKAIETGARWEYRDVAPDLSEGNIYLISLESLIVELLAHGYHNRDFGGQTLVLNSQIERFLKQLEKFGGQLKIIVFTSLATVFQAVPRLAFLRAAAIACLQTTAYAKDIVEFVSPLDNDWKEYIDRISPSLMFASADVLPKELSGNKHISKHLQLIALASLVADVPLVLFNLFTINFTTATGHVGFPEARSCEDPDQPKNEDILEENWVVSKSRVFTAIPVEQMTTTLAVWTEVIKTARETYDETENFSRLDQLAASAILSAMVCVERGIARDYLSSSNRPILDEELDHLWLTATDYLTRRSFRGCGFSIADLWDGRMVACIYTRVKSNMPVVPPQFRERLEHILAKCGLNIDVKIDNEATILKAMPEEDSASSSVLSFRYPINSPTLAAFVDMPLYGNAPTKQVRTDIYYKSKPVEDEPSDEEAEQRARRQASDKSQKRANWYAMLASTLEGRNTKLAVDFSRSVVASNVEPEPKPAEKSTKGWSGQKNKSTKSSIALIREKSDAEKLRKKAKTERDAIPVIRKFKPIRKEGNANYKKEIAESSLAEQSRGYCLQCLRDMLPALLFPENRALCQYELAFHEYEKFQEKCHKDDNFREVELRRREAVVLVNGLKECFKRHWSLLDLQQQNNVHSMWAALGLNRHTEGRLVITEVDPMMQLNIGIVQYQLEYAPETIDLEWDSQSDDRVTGYKPDAWQRDIMDSIDSGNSTLVLSPTSTGKSFVSFYAVEKLLRRNDDDVLVYVVPSEALMNQVCGSLCLRFSGKTMSPGRSVFGAKSSAYAWNELSCQVLVTTATCFEMMLLSLDADTQQFINRMKYVIFDEIQSIGTAPEAPYWERSLMLITCPFLAMSASVENVSELHDWIVSVKENASQTIKVDLKVFSEPFAEVNYRLVNFDAIDYENRCTDRATLVQELMPLSLMSYEKWRSFGIPSDMRMSALQVFRLYQYMAACDEETRSEFDPQTFFPTSPSMPKFVTSDSLRKYEEALRERFEELYGKERSFKIMIERLQYPVRRNLEARSYHQYEKEKGDLLHSVIVPLVETVRIERKLPAICFVDDAEECDELADYLTKMLEFYEEQFIKDPAFSKYFGDKKIERQAKAVKRGRDDARPRFKNYKNRRRLMSFDPEAPLPHFVHLWKLTSNRKALLEKFRLRGPRGADDDLYHKQVALLERRPTPRTDDLLRMFERGVGYHHDGMSAEERGAVETLFRSGHLGVVFATNTLSMGVHLPCKTVIIGMDTPSLTPLRFRQMIGRAGRRGHDRTAMVVFAEMTPRKLSNLVTSPLARIRGSQPLTASFLMNLFSWIHACADDDAAAVTERQTVALNLLRRPLCTRTPQTHEKLRTQLRLYADYSLQVCRHMELLDERCRPINLAHLALALRFAEPGNLTLVYLLQQGVLHQLFEKESWQKASSILVSVLATLFARRRMSHFESAWLSENESFTNRREKHALPVPPPFIESCLTKLRNECGALYWQYVEKAMGSMKDPNLTVSGSSASMANMTSCDYLVKPCRYEYEHDATFLPFIDINERDHRGRKTFYNSYAADFYSHGDAGRLTSENGIPTSEVQPLLVEFMKVLDVIAEETADYRKDTVFGAFATIRKRFKKRYDATYKSQKKRPIS